MRAREIEGSSSPQPTTFTANGLGLLNFGLPLKILPTELYTACVAKQRDLVLRALTTQDLVVCIMVSVASHLEQLSYQQQSHGQITRHHKPNSLSWTRQTQHHSPLPSPPLEQPPQFPAALTGSPGSVEASAQFARVGPYVVQTTPADKQLCMDTRTGHTLACQVYDLKTFHEKAHLFFSGLEGVHPVLDIQVTDKNAFVISNPTYGDLHQYLRQKRRLSETQAAPLFRQLVKLVCKAHSRGVALRDIKLKKIVFEDKQR